MCLKMLDLIAGCESIERQVAQVVGISDGNLHQIVVGTCNMAKSDDFGERERVVGEFLHLLTRMFAETHMNHRLQSDAKSRRIHICVSAFEDALFHQALHAGKATRWRQPHAGCQLFVGKARIILQFLQNSEVDSV